MLRIIKNADTSTVYSIDTVFDESLLKNRWSILRYIVKLNGSHMINDNKVFTPNTPIADIRMHHEYWGSASLANLPTGLKALALAAFAIQDSKRFSCYEFCIGANIFPKFVEIASDTNLIAIVAPELQLSLVSANMKAYKVLIDDKEGEIFC